MKKLIFDKCGDAKVLKLKELDIPSVKGKRKILVKVLHSSLNAVDWKYRRGYFRLFTRLFNTSLGFDVVGEIVEISSNINSCKKGDLIMGLLPNLQGGAHSEYIVLQEEQFIVISPQMNLVELAGLPMAGITAWLALIKKAKIKKGDKILINGGSSGVGHLAIQLAKIYGAEVTSVSSEKNQEFCRKLGADQTINYQNIDITTLQNQFDIVFDVVSNLSIRKVRKILTPNGCYIDTNISLRLIVDMVFNSNVKFIYAFPNSDGLTELYNLVKLNKLRVHIDRLFDLNEVIVGHEYIEQSRTIGKVIISM